MPKTNETTKLTTGELIIVKIDGLAGQGAGIGRHEGKAVFAHGAYPGDTATLRVTKNKKRHMEADIVRIDSPSPERQTPTCPHFGDCGGCQWMGLEYKTQLEWKKKITKDVFQRIGRMDVEVKDVIPSPSEFAYRARIRLKVICKGSTADIGFRRQKSHDIVAIEKCPVANDLVNTILAELKTAIATAPARAKKIDEVEIETDHTGKTGRIIINLTEPAPKDFIGWLEKQVPSAQGVALKLGKKITPQDLLSLTAKTPQGDKLSYGANVFSQVNHEQGLKLAELVIKNSALKPGDMALDLFCGMGNFTLPLAKEGVSMTAFDSSREAIDWAMENRSQMGIVTAQFEKGDAIEQAGKLLASGFYFDAVLLDPPRSGVGDKIKTVAALAKKRIVYVSCDPATAARDAALICMAGFKLEKVEPLDMFPQTPHIEIVMTFTKS